jgi:hypothetical protein
VTGKAIRLDEEISVKPSLLAERFFVELRGKGMNWAIRLFSNINLLQDKY